jgi:hypothetical protein
MSEETTASERDWRSAAACRLANPELFFPISAFGQALEQVAEAKAICALSGPAPVPDVRAANTAGARDLGRHDRGRARLHPPTEIADGLTSDASVRCPWLYPYWSRLLARAADLA